LYACGRQFAPSRHFLIRSRLPLFRRTLRPPAASSAVFVGFIPDCGLANCSDKGS
jgi:hypothetical protein